MDWLEGGPLIPLGEALQGSPRPLRRPPAPSEARRLATAQACAQAAYDVEHPPAAPATPTPELPADVLATVTDLMPLLGEDGIAAVKEAACLAAADHLIRVGQAIRARFPRPVRTRSAPHRLAA